MIKDKLKTFDLKRMLSFFHRLNFQHSKPTISILIPAFQGEKFILGTLDSLKDQTFTDFQVLVSIDKSEDKTSSIVTSWCKQNKKIPSKIFRQKHRLGWVKNVNFLLGKCKTKFFMVLPHDDLLDKNYLQKMHQCLKENPQACTVFSDIKGFGDKDLVIFQNSIRGNRLERTTEFLCSHYSAVAFRGLVNKEILSDFLMLPTNKISNFAIDTIWNLQMVIKGDLIRVPQILYHKRYLKTSVHDPWQKFGKEEKVKAWLEHCKDCLKIIFRAGFEEEDLEKLIQACQKRLLQKEQPLWASEALSNLNENEQNSLLENLLETIKREKSEIIQDIKLRKEVSE